MKISFSNIVTAIFIIFLLFMGASSALAASMESLPNPIGPANMTLLDLIIKVLQVLLGVVSLLAVSMFIWGGLVMLTSGGNPDRVKKAKDTLVWAVLGLAIIILSVVIVSYIDQNFRF